MQPNRHAAFRPICASVGAEEVLESFRCCVIRSRASMRARVSPPRQMLGICLLLAVVSTACRSAPYVWVGRYATQPVREGAGSPLMISPGDIVEVSVFGQEAMSTKGEVRSDGTLAMPLLGHVAVAGR